MLSRVESFYVQQLPLVAGGRNVISQIIMEDTSSFSGTTTHHCGEILDNTIISPPHLPIKHQTTTSSGSGASKFKGVVSQPNGHWGAQIYANHQRIWLGTFKSENEAAMAYDSAAIKLRNGFTNRNFPWTDITACEPTFQEQFSTEIILTMIKDGSYPSKFSDFLRAQGGHSLQLASLHDTHDTRLRQLFQKELTPSDVSKLNRLVIPKKFALKYFPRICDVKVGKGGNVDDLELVFFDQSMRSWNFRYCYWKSSQSFVFTRGWNRFAKEKGLRSRDRVIFSTYECSGKTLCIIDVAYGDRARGGGPVEEEAADESEERMDVEGGDSEMNESMPSASTSKGFTLFGVKILV